MIPRQRSSIAPSGLQYGVAILRSRAAPRASTAMTLLLALFSACSGGDGRTDSDESGAMEPDDDDDDDGDDDEDPDAQRDGARDAGSASVRDASRDPAGPGSSPPPGASRDAAVAAGDAGRRPGSGSDAATMAAADAGMAPGPGPAPADGTVCARWNGDRADLSEGTWTGNAEACEAGDMTEAARANALRSLNLYRFLAGLAPVTMDAAGNKLAQACALLMRANGTISHTPPTTWKCYTAEAGKTASASSLSSGPAVSSVDAYMIDPGNPTTIGHRRWILSNMLATVGFGSADRFSCQYQPAVRQGGSAAKPWVAWPPPGEIPLQAMVQRRGSVDMTGWTVQSDSINLQTAQVTVTSAGADRPVVVTQLSSGYGSRYALRFNPMGWTTKAGETYSVKLAGVSPPIEYDVQVVDCAR